MLHHQISMLSVWKIITYHHRFCDTTWARCFWWALSICWYSCRQPHTRGFMPSNNYWMRALAESYKQRKLTKSILLSLKVLKDPSAVGSTYFERITWKFLGPLPKSHSGDSYIMVTSLKSRWRLYLSLTRSHRQWQLNCKWSLFSARIIKFRPRPTIWLRAANWGIQTFEHRKNQDNPIPPKHNGFSFRHVGNMLYFIGSSIYTRHAQLIRNTV